MIGCLKLKPILVGLLILVISVLCSVGIVSVIKKESVPKPIYTIVVDAGHGGRDDGCSGSLGTKESDVNLAISRTLKEYLETLGVKVVMTRSDGNGLYKSNADNYKLSDMEKRLEIIKNVNPDMIISIHQNSFADSSQRGAQAFYQEGKEEAKTFADSVQRQLINHLPEARKESNFGDYYLLKESLSPAILIECGYLTNAEEEVLLRGEDYQNKVAYTIMCGVVDYLGLCGND